MVVHPQTAGETAFAGLAVHAISAYVLYILGLFIYRQFLHPLRNIPGPFLARVTGWYEFYHDVVQGGTYVKRFPKFHEKYGPLLRISPNHVHINDVQAHPQIFNPKEDFVHAKYFYHNVGVNESIISIVEPRRHRIRRNAMNPGLTPKAVAATEDEIAAIIGNAVKFIEQKMHDEGSVNIQLLYRRLTLDLICQALFSQDEGLVLSGKEKPPIVETAEMFAHGLWLMKHFSILGKIARNLPDSWANKIAPGYISLRQQCAVWINEVKSRRSLGQYTDKKGRATVMDYMLTPENVKGYEAPGLEQLIDDCIVMVIAGSESTMITLTYATYNLLKHPAALKKLKRELDEAPRGPDGRLKWKDISGLPYLGAIIKETLRISCAVPGPLPRVVPPQGFQWAGKTLPGGTVVSVAESTVHLNANNFEEPGSWIPERWLGPNAKELETLMIPFSRGPRSCVGKNLATVQIYMILATLFSHFDMELFKTDDGCMEWTDKGFLANRQYVKVKAKPVITKDTELI